MQAERFNKIDEAKSDVFKKLDQIVVTLRSLNLDPTEFSDVVSDICEYGRLEYRLGSQTVKAVYNVGIINE
jgi:Cdc6-like AAA superfamily ATPase